MKILLLEDNKFDADLISRSIRNKITEAIVLNVKTIAEALEVLKKENDFSAVLLDLNLPDGNGLEVLVEMRRKEINILTIVLTSVRDEEQAVIALKTGADDYFVKDSNNFSKLPDTLLHNLSVRHKGYKTAKALDILYFEHDSSVAKSSIDYFSKRAPHLKIDICTTKEETFEKLSLKDNEKCKYQACIIDYDLPNLDSLDTLKKIRQELKIDLPIIILTSHGNEEIAIQALKLGADEYIAKKDNYLLRLPSMVENAHKYYLLLKHKRVLEESERRYRLLAENVGDVIFTLNTDFEFTYVSPSVYNLKGYQPEELIKQNIEKCLTQESFFNFKGTIEKVLKAYLKDMIYMPHIVEVEMCKKDCSRFWAEIKISILSNEQKVPYGILGVTRDISIRKKYEQELIAAKEKAEENDRLKSAFLANISHEIRTPMNGILGFAELLTSQELDTNKLSLYVNAIEASGRRMLNTLNDLMDISKIEAGLIEINFSEFDLNKVLEYQYVFFKPETDIKNITLNYECVNPIGPFMFNSDKTKLNAILGNLIKNAIKYTNDGSVGFGYIVEENRLKFYVKDTGTGIPKESQSKIFERFVQASQDYTKQQDGSGLGLAISKSYVNALGGEIWLESEPNRGSIFYFTLPYIIKSHNLPENKKLTLNLEIKNKSKFYKQKSLMIVDDDELSQTLLYEAFKDSFETILIANNGHQAIEICSKRKVDIIFMDIKMPGLNGFETTKKIKEINKDIVVIVQSAFALRPDQKHAERLGYDAYFTKPIKKNELFKFIDKKMIFLSQK